MGGVEIELLSLATGALIVSKFKDLSRHKLGRSRRVREFNLGSSGSKVVILEGCMHSRSVTILVRGGNTVVMHETERSINDALCVASSLLKLDIAVFGGGSTEISSALCMDSLLSSSNSMEHYTVRAFSNALDEIPLSLASNCGDAPVYTIS